MKRGGIGSDRARWDEEGRHRQRQGEVGGIGSDRERLEAEGRHRQRQRARHNNNPCVGLTVSSYAVVPFASPHLKTYSIMEFRFTY